MPAYADFTTSRTTVPDPVALRTAVQAATGDATAVLYNLGGGWHGKKAAPWAAADLAATQTALDTAVALTPQLAAQHGIDAWPIDVRAFALALIDETNRLRAALRGLGVVGLPDITPAQAIAAIRAKAGTL